MRTDLKGSFWVTLTLTAFVLFACVLSVTYGPKERMIPLMVGVGCLVLCIVLLLGEKFPNLVKRFDISVQDLMKKDKLNIQTVAATRAEQNVVRRTLTVGSWSLGYLISIYFVGFHIANPLFLILFLKISGKISWPKTILLTIITWAFIYGLFNVMLKQEIFKGVLFDAYVPPL